MRIFKTEARRHWLLVGAAVAAMAMMGCKRSSGGGSSATGVKSGAAGPLAARSGSVVEDNAACENCEIAGTKGRVCFNTSTQGAAGTSPSNFGCDSFANATDKANCLALLACLRSPACQSLIAAATPDYGEAQVNKDDGTPCLCNSPAKSITKFDCLGANTWSGVCATQFAAASKNSAAKETPVMALFDTSFPVGVAMNLMTCDIDTSQAGSGAESCRTPATCNIPQ